MDQSWTGDHCDWTLLDPEVPVGTAEEEGGEGTGGLQEGEDEGAPQGEEEEASDNVCVSVHAHVT